MRVNSVNFNIYSQYGKNKTDRQKLVQSKVPASIEVRKVSFGNSAPNAEFLRMLFKYKIPDFYSDIIILDPDIANKIYKSRVFSTTLADIKSAIAPIKSSLFPIEKKMYRTIAGKSKFNPDMTLNEYIKDLFPYHNRRLERIQRPILAELKEIALDFPADLLEQFNYLMYITEQRIEGNSVFIPFSIKEFKYKLNRIRARIGSSPNTEEGIAMNKLLSIAGTVPVVSKEKRMGQGFKINKYEDAQKTMMDKFIAYFEHSALKDNEDIEALIKSSHLRVYKVPLFMPFSRKTFIHDLEKITDRLSDTKLAHSALKTALSLPTSKQDVSAFIVKSASRSAEQIGYDLLNGSVGTIDHLVSSYKYNGEDNIYNYVMSSAYKNSQKSHKRLPVFIKENPEIRDHTAQRHVDYLINLANAGVFKHVHLDSSYITHLAKKVEQLTSKSTPLILDTNKLLY